MNGIPISQKRYEWGWQAPKRYDENENENEMKERIMPLGVHIHQFSAFP